MYVREKQNCSRHATFLYVKKYYIYTLNYVNIIKLHAHTHNNIIGTKGKKKYVDNKSLNNKKRNDCSSDDDDDCLINLLPVFLSGKSESYLAIEDGGWGILYGWELTDDAVPTGKDSPDELFNIPLQSDILEEKIKQEL